MEEKKDIIYDSSQEDLIKLVVLLITFGISVMASLLDYKSCYVTILVQAVNNMYDFYRFTDNKTYTTMVKREAIAIILFSAIAIIASITGLVEVSDILKSIWVRLLIIALVTIPLAVVYSDYKINVFKENELEV